MTQKHKRCEEVQLGRNHQTVLGFCKDRANVKGSRMGGQNLVGTEPHQVKATAHRFSEGWWKFPTFNWCPKVA